MMKPKVALVKDGFLPAGSENVRGRLSGAAIQRCMELAAEGWDIEGYAAKGSVAEGNREVAKVAAPVGEKVIADIVYRFPLDTPATAEYDGHKVSVSMKEACGNCRVSLVCCSCGQPNVVRPDGRGSMAVTMKGYND